jgi:hypothetical protein
VTNYTAKRLVGLCTLILLCITSSANAQPWSGVLSPARAVDWRSAGVSGGIPSRTTICATLNPGATASQINSAISACPNGQVVFLNAGTYTLSSGIVFSKSGVTLRGNGAHSTKLIINGTTSGCSLFYSSAVRMCAGSGNIGTTAGGGPGPDHSATWTAGYAQGSTVISLSNTTGLSVGSTIFLDQLNDARDGWPAAGDLYVCDDVQPCSWEGGNSYARVGRVQTELHAVTAINGTNVTISPAIMAPNFRASQSPGAWWGNTVLQNSGIEDLTIDFTGGSAAGIEVVNATNCWLRGLRLINSGGPGSFVFHVLIVNGFRITTRDSYFYGPSVQGNTQYAYTPHVSGSLLFENNILHHNVAPTAPNDPEVGSVYAYNYVHDAYYATSGFQQHNAGDLLNLFEGNNVGSMFSDNIHGSHFFLTYFRNHLDGHAHNPGGNTADSGFVFWSHNRFHNVIGNVIGGTHFTTYETNLADSGKSIFLLGFEGSHGGTSLGSDSNVKRTLMRWGNWDSVNAGTRFVAAEVPSSISSFANAVPSSQALPASMYLPGKPSWFGSNPFPPIGPDVTGGNISGFGGHANKIPARVCFESTAVDSAYSSLGIKLFNASGCYGSSSSPTPPPPSAPSNLRVIK